MNYKNKTSVLIGDPIIGPIDGATVVGRIHSFEGEKVKGIFQEQTRSVLREISTAEFYRADEAIAAADLVNSGKVIPLETAAPATTTQPAQAS